MNTNMLAADEADRTTRTGDERHRRLAEELRALDEVDDVEATFERAVPRVRIDLSTANVTGAVDDLLDLYRASVDPGTVEVRPTGGLRFEVTTPALFRQAGTRDAREYGASTAWTFTRESLELSGFDEDSTLDARARPGAVLLTERDGDA